VFIVVPVLNPGQRKVVTYGNVPGRGGLPSKPLRLQESPTPLKTWTACRIEQSCSAEGVVPSQTHRQTILTQEVGQMVPSEVFIQHAAECEFMAEFSRDPGNKEIWRRMAKRWIRCAALARRDSSPQDRRKTRMHRKPAPASSNTDRVPPRVAPRACTRRSNSS
jgi:hypothetical protein